MIIRTVKDRENPYVMINKNVLNDARLDYRARGVLSYLLSKPDNWKTNIKEIASNSPEGEDSIKSALNDLKRLGYYKKYPIKEKGKIVRWESEIYETPIEVNCEKYSDNRETHEKSSLGDLPLVQYTQKEIPLPENTDVEIPKVAIALGAKSIVVNPLHNNNYNNNIRQTDRRTDLIPLSEIKYKMNFNQNWVFNGRILDDIVLTLYDIVNADNVKIGGSTKPLEVRREVYNHITGEIVNKIAQKILDYPKKVKNKKAWLQSVVYNTILENEFCDINDRVIDKVVGIIGNKSGNKQSVKTEQYKSYEQRKYSDEEFASMYKQL
jgi:hypothetical protein